MITFKKSAAKYRDSNGSMQDVGMLFGQNTVDKTLTQSGMPADAGAVGEKIGEVEEKIGYYSTYVTPQMFGAKGDGETDDTEAIQNALDASSFVYFPDGTYMINATYSGYGYESEGGIKPNSGQTIIMSRNAILKAISSSTSFYHIINLIQVNNVYIFGGKVEGDKEYHEGTDGEHGHGISIGACDDIVISEMESFNCWGDALYIGKGGGIANSNNIRVYNCLLHDSRRQGISITGATDVIIRDCEIYNISGTDPQSGIDIEPDGDIGVAKNISIESCKIYDTTGASLIISRVTNAIQTINMTNCTMSECSCLSGTDIKINNSSIGKIRLANENVMVNNSSISEILLVSGNGIFTNCEFIDDTIEHIITSDMSYYPSYHTEHLTFRDCIFRTSSSSDYLMYMGAMSELTDDIPTEQLIKFDSCTLKVDGSCLLANRMPEKTIMINCTVIFENAPYALFQLKNIWTTRLIIRESVFEWPDTCSYLLDFGAFDGYSVDIRDSSFSSSSRCIYMSSSGSSGGKITMVNNTVSSEAIYNDHTFTIILANEHGYLTEHQSLDNYATVDNAEEWTFTLEDGTTVTKKVVLI